MNIMLLFFISVSILMVWHASFLGATVCLDNYVFIQLSTVHEKLKYEYAHLQ